MTEEELWRMIEFMRNQIVQIEGTIEFVTKAIESGEHLLPDWGEKFMDYSERTLISMEVDAKDTIGVDIRINLDEGTITT